MINKNFLTKKFNKPFPYLKIQNFLEQDFFNKLVVDFPKLDDFKKNERSVKRMDYDTSFGDSLYNNLLSNSNYYKKFHDFVYSEKFINFFLEYFKKDIYEEINAGSLLENINNFEIKSEPYEVGGVLGKKQLNSKMSKFIYPRIDLGLGLKGYGEKNGGGGIHIDNPQRIISILFYVGGYDSINGGDHRIWKKTENGDNLEIFEEIKPEKNLLIAGLQNNFAFHDVNPIKEIKGSRNAFYMAISSSIPVWKSVKNDNFNIEYNKNRVKLNFIQRFKKKYLSRA
jgi:hypothetical protein